MSSGNELSKLIESNIESIINQWEAQVRAEVPGASFGLSHKDLINGLPAFLENLARFFSVRRRSSDWSRVLQKKSDIAKEHGRQRARLPGYTLDQVIAEHQILRRVLFSFIQKELRLKPEQWSILLESMDEGISQAATSFALDRGFRDARYRRMEAEKGELARERNQAHSELNSLQVERATREQFVSTLSHDLRTPITSAKTAAELIVRNPADTQQVTRLAFRVIDDLSRTDRMIRGLLDSNRIRAGEKLPLEIRETKLVELVNQTIGNLAKVYGDRFVVKADHEIVGFWNGKDLERSIENLVINAVKYGAPDTPITLRVDDQGEQVRLSVHNFGSLITPSEQEELFLPFSRIINSGRSTAKGWGLGLTLVLCITQAHGGTVQVESDANTGTTFTMVIPKDARLSSGRAA